MSEDYKLLFGVLSPDQRQLIELIRECHAREFPSTIRNLCTPFNPANNGAVSDWLIKHRLECAERAGLVKKDVYGDHWVTERGEELYGENL